MMQFGLLTGFLISGMHLVQGVFHILVKPLIYLLA